MLKLPQTPPSPSPRFWTPSTLLLSTTLLFISLSAPIPVAAAAAAAANGGEANALFSWLHSSNTTPPISFSNWNSLDPDPCNWTSITCNPQGRVAQINIRSIPLDLPLPLLNLSAFAFLEKLVISDANLTGVILAAIVACSELTVIDLSNNDLAGTIPYGLGNLQKLESLILNTNQLAGKIPADIGNCSGLMDVMLFDNQLAGAVPPELGRLSKLQSLRVGLNSGLAGEIPGELGDCCNLVVLGLANTGVSGSIPPSLGRLRKLRSLSIYTTMISGEIPPELGNCSELEALSLYENGLSGKVPPELGRLSRLRRLLLWQNTLEGDIPPEIGNCTKLNTIDLSLNSLSGTIPASIGNLAELEEFMISDNDISGTIPVALSMATNLIQLQLYNNHLSGLIPPELGELTNLVVFFAWQNQLEGSIPASLANCTQLNALDLSRNSLVGTVPPAIFRLQNLTKLLLISNHLSGAIPPEIGSCAALVRLRLAGNRLSGEIPKEIGRLTDLNFLDLSRNRLSGNVPDQMGGCADLQMIDLSNNHLEGPLPDSISSLSGLQLLDVSANNLSGQVPESIGQLKSLNKLILSRNSVSGTIPATLGSCSGLQLLDLSSNQLSGVIPGEICQIEALEIALNLSFNGLSGQVPSEAMSLNKLSVMDLSHNRLHGNLAPLAGLDNLISLNVSYNHFTGALPDTSLFRHLSAADLAGNDGLCNSQSQGEFCFSRGKDDRTQGLKLAMALLVTMTAVMLVWGVFALIRARRTVGGEDVGSESGGAGGGESCRWQFTPFQKLNFSVEQVLRCLVDSNMIGKGCSGVVYRAEMDNGEIVAVKKLWPSAASAAADEAQCCSVRDSFSTEIRTLGSIRHKNIVRFLGCCWNRSTRLLMYDYMPNGSLGSLLHERTGASSSLDWGLRYNILLGAAQGVAYLHHDCVPPIVHRDIKANNILVGLEFEPYIADFGIAKLVDEGDFARSSSTIAGSYGYIAPEYGYKLKITEKSDVYSYGVVALEVLTGKQPIDPTIPNGAHVVDWVRQVRGGVEVLDPTMLSRCQPEVEEMIQALGIALLCVNSTPDERPTMKDVAAMLMEIKHEGEEYAKVDALVKGSPAMEVAATSSTPRIEGTYPAGSNNTSFSASSLRRSSSATAKLSSE